MEIFQRTLSFDAHRRLSLKADAKVRLFSEPPKLFELFFRFLRIIFSSLDLNQTESKPTPFYYIRAREYIAYCGHRYSYNMSTPYTTKSHTKKPRRNPKKGRRGQKSETCFSVWM